MTTEFEQRKEAIRLSYQGVSKSEISRRLKRPRRWVDRWLRRYDPDDVEGSLSNRRSGPKAPHSPWSAEIHQQVVEMRRQREQAPYALVGAEAIHYELKALDSRELPAVRTIHRWLEAAGLIEGQPTVPERREPKPIPLPPATEVNAVQQLDLKGPVYLHGSDQKYYLAVLRDRFSRRCAIDALRSREAQEIVDFLVSSWHWMGLPSYLQLDNALEFRGSNRYPRSFGRVVRVAVDLEIEPLFNPPSEPWRNGCVERHNGFLAQRLLAIECADFDALRQEARRCQDHCNRTHRLSALDGRTPEETCALVTLRCLSNQYNRHRARSLPQNRGFVSFVRLVRKSGRITLAAGDRFMIDPDLAYTYVLARVDLTNRIVVISQADTRLRTYDYSAATVGAWADANSPPTADPACNTNGGTCDH